MNQTYESKTSQRNCAHGQLSDIAYYFSKGADLLPTVDSTQLDPILAQIVENIRPLAVKVGPYARQLWAHLERE